MFFKVYLNLIKFLALDFVIRGSNFLICFPRFIKLEHFAHQVNFQSYYLLKHYHSCTTQSLINGYRLIIIEFWNFSI